MEFKLTVLQEKVWLLIETFFPRVVYVNAVACRHPADVPHKDADYHQIPLDGGSVFTIEQILLIGPESRDRHVKHLGPRKSLLEDVPEALAIAYTVAGGGRITEKQDPVDPLRPPVSVLMITTEAGTVCPYEISAVLERDPDSKVRNELVTDDWMVLKELAHVALPPHLDQQSSNAYLSAGAPEQILGT